MSDFSISPFVRFRVVRDARDEDGPLVFGCKMRRRDAVSREYVATGIEVFSKGTRALPRVWKVGCLRGFIYRELCKSN